MSICIEVQKKNNIWLLDSKGMIEAIPDIGLEEARRQFRAYRACYRHGIVCKTKKVYKLHVREQHAY